MQHLQPFALFEARASGTLSKRQEAFLNRYTQGTWSVNPATGLVDVKGLFDCSGRGLKSLYGIQFGQVTGDFWCVKNLLTSLAGAPQTVTGNFYCSSNHLTSLAGAPQTVGGGFTCAGNRLTSLEGAPQTVGGGFYCANNLLTSLVGTPQTVEGGFSCSNNLLTSLVGAPQQVEGNFDCYHNQLTDLEGAPKTVGGDFRCYNNLLTSLAGAPQTVEGYFFCYINQLTSLAGAPLTVTGNFWSDAFDLGPGQWNPAGWVQVLREGDPAARRLVLTLPAFDAQFWLNRLKGDLKQDGQTLLQLADLWQSPGWEEEQARLQQKLDPGQLRAIQALRGKLAYVDPWQDFKL